MFNPTPIRPHKVLIFSETSEINVSTVQYYSIVYFLQQGGVVRGHALRIADCPKRLNNTYPHLQYKIFFSIIGASNRFKCKY